uniref:Uncharacterized protein n=1 Tax=Anguilla anguilla TaxID=7936 RepID=A0A0E9TN20_ANGAN
MHAGYRLHHAQADPFLCTCWNSRTVISFYALFKGFHP